jgi:hypothetical protein
MYAKEALVGIGEPAIAPLVSCLYEDNDTSSVYAMMAPGQNPLPDRERALRGLPERHFSAPL